MSEFMEELRSIRATRDKVRLKLVIKILGEIESEPLLSKSESLSRDIDLWRREAATNE